MESSWEEEENPRKDDKLTRKRSEHSNVNRYENHGDDLASHIKGEGMVARSH
jgi:hypothetical protein